MTIEEAGHIPPEEIASTIEKYPGHEREARARGIPMLGSGLIYQIPPSSIEVEPFALPDFWPRIMGCDFGYGDHPFAAVKMAWDREADIYYVTHEYKESQPTPALHASALRPWGLDTPVAWPHDGNRDFGDSGPVAQLYRKEGLKMLHEHATFQEGGYSTESAIQIVLSRMQTSRFKIFQTCTQTFNEISTYHRKDGKIVKKNDDLLSSIYKAVMMIRYARVPAGYLKYTPKVKSDFDPFNFSEAS